MLSDQPLAAKEKAKRKRNKYVDYCRYKHIQKLVQDIAPMICTEVLCRSLLAAPERWLAAIPLLCHFYAFILLPYCR